MGFNIMDLVKDQISDAVVGQIGGFLGEKPKATRSAMDSAIPAILGGLANVAGNKRGASSMFDTLNDQDDSILDNLGDLLGGKQASSTMDMGSSLLGGLMGNGGLGNLVGTLAGFTGMGKKSSGSLVGLLAPIVLGVIKRKVFGGSSGGTIGALTSLFSGQKDNITNAMPTGLNDQLSSSGFFDSLTNNFADTAEDVGRATRNAGHAAQEQVADAAKGGSSLFRKLLPIIILAALAWFALQMFGGKKEEQVVPTPAAPTSSIEVPDYGGQIGSIFQNTTDSFSRITDVATATEELPNLRGALNDFDGFGKVFGEVTDNTVRGPVIEVAKGAFSKLEPVVGKVLEIPGVGDVIKPTTDSLMEMLNKLVQ